MSLLAGALTFPTKHVVPKDDTPRCEAALLFCNLLLGGLLPLLLLAPLSGGGARRAAPTSCPLARLERALCRALRLFLYELHPADGGRAERVPCLSPLVLRWMVLVACTWAASCLLYL